MSDLSSDKEQLVAEIRNAEDATTGAHRREAARAKLDALLVSDLTASLGQLGKQMADSSAAAARHQRALVIWTVVLSIATIAYALGAFLQLWVMYKSH